MRLLLPLLLVLLIAGADAGAAIWGGWIPFEGSNNDDPMVATTKAGKVQSMVLAFRPTCTDGRQFAFHRRLPVRIADGPGGELVPVVNGGGRFRGTLRAMSVSDQYRFTESGTVTGVFGRSSARGTIAVTVTVADAETGASVMTCKTRTLRWTLKRRLGRVYGGSTAQGEPVMMTLTANRRKVYEFGIDFHASCSPSGFLDAPDWLTNFPIRSGRFGDRFNYKDDEGNLRTYRFAGRVTRRSASGSISITLKSTSGAVCRTGSLTWRMKSG